jgi:hypothetical protein
LDLFKFILIITSVVYALALAQILTGIARLAQAETAIRLFLPHTVWIAVLFIAILFVSPILIFFATSLLIPQSITEAGTNLEKHFNKIRRPVLISYFIVLVAQFVDGTLLANQPWRFPGRLPNTPFAKAKLQS